MPMRSRVFPIPALLVLTLSIVGCSPDNSAPESKRPVFGASHVALGERVYKQNCAKCHGAEAQGDVDWRRPGADGFYPPPPLNGTGHAWHHPRDVLRDVIMNGSPEGQGNMPAWKDQLRPAEVEAVITWFQSLWSEEVYEAWWEMQERNK